MTAAITSTISGLRQQRIWLAVVLLSLAGIGMGTYLTMTHFADKPIVCAGLGSCATVQDSAYAKFLGMPVALLGLGAYAAIGGLALLAPRLAWAAIAAFGVAFGGLLYSAYLTYVELAVIDAICLWCVGSAINITVITALTLAGVLREPSPAVAPALEPVMVPQRRLARSRAR